VCEEVGDKNFREKLLIWGTQEVLPVIFSGKQMWDDRNVHQSIMKVCLVTIREALQKTHISQGHEPRNISSQQESNSQASQPTSPRAREVASRRGSVSNTDATKASSSAAFMQKTAGGSSSRGNQKPPPIEEESSDSESSAASEDPRETASNEIIKTAFDKLLKLAYFGADCAPPEVEECPELFKVPGAISAFPRAWKLVLEKFPHIEKSAKMPFTILSSTSLAARIRNEKGFPFQPETTSVHGNQNQRYDLRNIVPKPLSGVPTVGPDFPRPSKRNSQYSETTTSSDESKM
jgi:hypothetical protein